MDFFSGVFDIVRKSGTFGYPIILCSIFGLAIFLQKMWMLRINKIVPYDFLEHLYGFLRQGKFGGAEAYTRQSNASSISRIAIAAFENSNKSRGELRVDIEEAGEKEALELTRHISWLGAISNVSTLLGLLGTISGMIKIFGVIADSPVVNPPELAGGISEALYTTAFGLFVAIPAFIAYRYISSKADELIFLMEEEGRRIMEYVMVTQEKSDVV